MKLSKDMIASANKHMRNRSKKEYKPKMRTRTTERASKPSTTTSSTRVAKPAANASTNLSGASRPSLGAKPVKAKKRSPRSNATMAAKAIGLGGLAKKIRRREQKINNIK